MKAAIKRLLAKVGVAPAAHLARLEADVRRAEARAAQLEQRLVTLRSEADTWKRRHEDAADASAGWKLAARRAQAELDRLKEDAGKGKKALEREKAAAERDKARLQDVRGALDRARSRLVDARRGMELSNEQLMAMEVKLDLIEAAIQVLDGRTREQSVSRASAARADP